MGRAAMAPINVNAKRKVQQEQTSVADCLGFGGSVEPMVRKSAAAARPPSSRAASRSASHSDLRKGIEQGKRHLESLQAAGRHAEAVEVVSEPKNKRWVRKEEARGLGFVSYELGHALCSRRSRLAENILLQAA